MSHVPSPRSQVPYAIIGRIRKAHGIKGDLVIEALTDAPDATFAPGRRVFAGNDAGELHDADNNALEVMQARPFKEGLILALRGIRTRNDAELMRGRYLFAPMDELAPPSEGEVWLHEITGMRVVHVDGSAVGDVRNVEEMPQGLMLTVSTPRGDKSVPFVDAIVTNVDRDSRTITIDPPEGLLEL